MVKPADAVEEVLAEGAARDLGLEILVGREEDARADVDLVGAADAGELPALEHAEELRLQREVELADLVEEERAVAGGLEVAHLPARRAGEGAALVPEELALEEGSGDGAAVEADEGPVGARARRVDRLGDDLFARAGLAGQQDVHAGRRDPTRERKHLDHGGLGDEDAAAHVEGLFVGDGAGEGDELGDGGAVVREARDGGAGFELRRRGEPGAEGIGAGRREERDDLARRLDVGGDDVVGEVGE